MIQSSFGGIYVHSFQQVIPDVLVARAICMQATVANQVLR